MNKGSIFVGGVHGSGKTQLCKKIQEVIPCNYISASQLLQWKKKEKTVENVLENQKKLKEILLKNIRPNELNLIDGHFALWNKDFKCETVPLDFFENLFIKAIVVINENSETVYNRLLHRNLLSFSLRDIQQLAHAEYNHAKIVSERLRVPFLEVNENEIEVIFKQIGI